MTDTTGRISAAPQDAREPRTTAGDELLTQNNNDPEAPSYHVIRLVRRAIPDIEDEAGALDVDRLADVLTLRHVQTAGGCSESHRPEAAAIAAAYARLSTAQPSAEGGSK